MNQHTLIVVLMTLYNCLIHKCQQLNFFHKLLSFYDCRDPLFYVTLNTMQVKHWLLSQLRRTYIKQKHFNYSFWMPHTGKCAAEIPLWKLAPFTLIWPQLFSLASCLHMYSACFTMIINEFGKPLGLLL